ncbi:MAG: hypothetical protein MZU95_09435 [Desulfomicrobium escambiense]|nr:hypothetical protein [Desulfomicrobium escambiense]
MRTTHSVVATEATSIGGWLICTAMKISPAAAALQAGDPGEVSSGDSHEGLLDP